jgi:ferritin-like metal-binding protein YciE
MPNYDELIQQSQVNVNALSDKLKELDELHQDIKRLIELPETFDIKFQEIVQITEGYTNTLGDSTKKYLDACNTIFIENLQELSNKSKELSKDFQTKIDELKEQVIRLEGLDLDRRLNWLNSASTQIFNTIRTNHTATTTQITNFSNATQASLNAIQTRINANHSETTDQIIDLEHHILKSLAQQNSSLKKQIKTNRIIQIVGIIGLIGILSILLIYK